MVKVVHCKKAPYDVYVGRPTKWGNPFEIGKDGTREEVINKYADWLLNQSELIEALPELKGKILACWCAPLACHADVLYKAANKCGECYGLGTIPGYCHFCGDAPCLACERKGYC